jgi:hypothetical protein
MHVNTRFQMLKNSSEYHTAPMPKATRMDTASHIQLMSAIGCSITSIIERCSSGYFIADKDKIQ